MGAFKPRGNTVPSYGYNMRPVPGVPPASSTSVLALSSPPAAALQWSMLIGSSGVPASMGVPGSVETGGAPGTAGLLPVPSGAPGGPPSPTGAVPLGSAAQAIIRAEANHKPVRIRSLLHPI